MMASAVLRPRLCEATWYKRMKCKTLNPKSTQTSHNVGNLLKVSPRNKVDSKILGQKRVVHATPDRETKRRLVNKVDSTCEKFMVERGQSVIVEHQKFSKPLAEFTKSQLVSSQRVTERSLHMHSQEALPKKICKEVVKKTESEHIRIVSQAKENPPMRREMSAQERDQLGLVLVDFADKYFDEILQIVAKRNPNMTTPDEEGEIELDVQAVDSETMWDLHRFLRLKLKAE